MTDMIKTETEKEYNNRARATRILVRANIRAHVAKAGAIPAAILAAGETFSMLIEDREWAENGADGSVLYMGIPLLLVGRGAGCYMVSSMREINVSF